MSAIASFYLLDTSKLDELTQNAEIITKKSLFSKKVTDNYWGYLSNNSKELNGFGGSGYIYGNLLVYLQEEKNIDLTQNEYDNIAKNLLIKEGILISCSQINKRQLLSTSLTQPNIHWQKFNNSIKTFQRKVMKKQPG